MSEDKQKLDGAAWFTLSGDVNSDMVHRVFEAVADMTEDGVETAHILLQSNGGYVSDGICLYNYLSKLPIKIVTYNAGAVASIAERSASALRSTCSAAGIAVETRDEWDDPAIGRFARIHDPEGNAIELWEPPASA